MARWSFLSLLLGSLAAAKVCYVGVNESGGEFGVWSATSTKGTGLPGTFGVDYSFINKSTIDIWVDTNRINTFRVAFLLERMCPLATGLGKTFDETYFGHFKDAIDYITVTKGAYAILDPHNYMRYNDPSQQPMTGSVIGNLTDPTAATVKQWVAFWSELARRFKSNEKVIFGIMNEPHDMPSTYVLANDQAAIDAIRTAGAKQMIIAPGNGWTGGHSWFEDWAGNSSLYMNRLVDPLNNTAIDIHEYLDSDFSGSHQNCTQPGPANLARLTAWLRTNGLKAMVTEFGGYPNEGCHGMLQDLIKYMAANDEYIGWTAWAAGPIWGTNSPCCADNVQAGSLEPNSVGANGKPGFYETVWQPWVQPLVPKQLKWSGVSHIGACSNATLGVRSHPHA